MPKIFEFKPVGIKCDAPGCGWSDMSVEMDMRDYGKAWLNAPCPECGSNLYTEADYKLVKRLKRSERVINGLFGWVMWLVPKDKQGMVDGMSLNSDGRGVVTQINVPDDSPLKPALQKALENRRDHLTITYSVKEGKRFAFIKDVVGIKTMPLRTRFELVTSALFSRDGKASGRWRGTALEIAALSEGFRRIGEQVEAQ